jgi:predicted nucleotide-binding protein
MVYPLLIMEKSKTYYLTHFSVDTIRRSILKIDPEAVLKNIVYLSTEISYQDIKWKFDSLDEFFAEYNKATSFVLHIQFASQIKDYYIFGFPTHTSITINAKERSDIESIFQIFEQDLDKSRIIISPKPLSIFIGHGGDTQWRLLKDHLHEIHGFAVDAYEIAPRAGKSVKEVLQDMLNKNSIALLVLTGEDIKNYDEIHARQNVVHELGLFQGRLGFERAMIILEEGVKEFSNISGVNQIRFSKGNIREVYGDVLGVIKREFADES